MCFKVHAKEVQDALEAASAKAKARSFHEDACAIEYECEVTRSRGFYFDRMREAAEKVPVTGLLPVGRTAATLIIIDYNGTVRLCGPFIVRIA